MSDRHPYMFSGSLDKEVKCWDLEYNKARVSFSVKYVFSHTIAYYSKTCVALPQSAVLVSPVPSM